MLSPQATLVFTAFVAFSICLAGVKVMAKNYGPIPFITDLDAATNLRDPQVAAAFAIGLALSLAVLFFAFSSSE